MARQEQQAAVFSIDTGDLFAALSVTAAKEEKRQKEVTAKKSTRRGGGRKGQKRQRGENTGLTQDLVYRIKDQTTGTIHIVVGLGDAEKLVDKLIQRERTLVRFTHYRSGNKMPRPDYYQCIMDNRGKKAGYRYFWQPTEAYPNCQVHGSEVHKLVTTTPVPYFRGGLMFALKSTDPEDDSNLDQYSRVSLGKTLEDDAVHLKAVKKSGKTVMEQAVNPDVWLMGMAAGEGIVATRDTVDQFRKYLDENLISWPPTAAQLSIIAQGGTLHLADDMKPDATTKPVFKSKPFGASNNWKPSAAPAKVEPEHKLWHVFGIIGEKRTTIPLAVGTEDHCKNFVKVAWAELESNPELSKAAQLYERFELSLEYPKER